MINKNIQTAIISVFDKTGIVEFSQFLINKGIKIISTGGTYNKLISEIDSSLITEVSNITRFPEILNGRVKTLHPKIHGALLAKRDNILHIDELSRHNISKIDMVVVNLYPFEQIIKKYENQNSENVPEQELDEILENIDIGGHTLIRAGAKNFKDVMVITDPKDYKIVMDSWNAINIKANNFFAKKAFHHACQYDIAISQFFNPDNIYRCYTPIKKLKYGTNPQQTFAGLYKNTQNDQFPFEILNGNPGYINFLDAIYSWNLATELAKEINLPTVASFKHNSPAGVGTFRPIGGFLRDVYFVGDKDLTPVATAYIRARNVDPMSSFGDFLAFSHPVDECTAKLIASEVSDGIVAPDYSPEAFEILSKKKKGCYVILKGDIVNCKNLEVREMHGVTLIQDENNKTTGFDNLHNVVTSNNNLNEDIMIDLIIANTTLKYTQSNSVCSSKDGQILGVGAGQQSRIDCVKLVKKKTSNWYLRQHPKTIKLMYLFKKGIKKSIKINAIIRYIENEFTNEEYKEWLNLFVEEPEKLTNTDKIEYLKTLDNVSLASDAFFPFRDNIDVSSQFGVKYIVQPGGSVADEEIIKTCDSYGMTMVTTGGNMRMFLH